MIYKSFDIHFSFNIHLVSAPGGNRSLSLCRETSRLLSKQSVMLYSIAIRAKINIHTVLIAKSQKFYTVKRERTLLKLFQLHILLPIVYFSFLLGLDLGYISGLLMWKLSHLVSLACILFMYVGSGTGNNFSFVALGITCIYLKSCNHELVTHI